MKFKFNESQRQWIDSLKGGKFKQGHSKVGKDKADLTGKLHVKHKGKHYYCCLGVACEVVKKKCRLDVFQKQNLFCYNSNSSTLPGPVCEEIDIGPDGRCKMEGYYRFGSDGVKYLSNPPNFLKSSSGYHVKSGEFEYWEAGSLAYFNDQGLPFEKIALLLETYPHHFFG